MRAARALLALALALLACRPAAADRELFTLDCNMHVHFLPGFPVGGSGGFLDLDDMFNHIVAKLRKRVECYCGGEMAPDEFNRKYHPFPALLNLVSKTPVVSEECDQGLSVVGLIKKFSESIEDIKSFLECVLAQ